MASAGGAAGPVGGLPAKNEISEVDMEIMELPERKAERVGLKRAWGSPNAMGSEGFIGLTTAEEKPTLQAHNNGKFLKEADNGNLVDDTSKMGGIYLHGIHGSQTLPDSNALRFNSSSPGGDLGSKTRKPTKICTFYAQGQCKKGNNCTSLHEREGSGSDNRWSEDAGLLAPVGYGNHRGSEEGSQAQGLSNLKDPQFENFVSSSKDGSLYRTLIHAYGEDNRGLAHNSTKPTPPINELVQIPRIQEKNREPYFMGRHISLASDSYLNGWGTFPRLHLDGEKLMPDVAKGNSLSDRHISRIYPEVNPLNPDYLYRPFDSSASFDSLQPREKLSAYGGPTDSLPHKHQKEHSSSFSSYNSNSLTLFRNPGHNSSDYSLGIPPLGATAYLGVPSLHQLTPGIEKVGLHKDVNSNKSCGPSRPALPVNSSCQPVAMPSGHLSPITDEPWVTSVPFVPSVSFPGSTSPLRGQYDPLLDSIDPGKVKRINSLKSSNISCSVSSQHTDENVIIGGHTNKSLNCDDKLATNTSAKGSNEFVGLIAPDRGRSSSLDGDNMVKSCERKNGAAVNNDKTRDFCFHLAEHVKELLKPIWKEGDLSKDAHKLIVKKSVHKVLASLEPHQVPATEELISDYITTSGTKIEKLVKAYVDRHHTR